MIYGNKIYISLQLNQIQGKWVISLHQEISLIEQVEYMDLMQELSMITLQPNMFFVQMYFLVYIFSFIAVLVKYWQLERNRLLFF